MGALNIQELELVKKLSEYVVEDLCPEEKIFFNSVFVNESSSRRGSPDLAFGVDGEEVLLTALIVEAVKCALSELWDIIKPALKDLAQSGIEEAKVKAMNKIFNKEADGFLQVSNQDLERITVAAQRSAVRNGCSVEQAKKIAQSVARSIKSSKSR